MFTAKQETEIRQSAERIADKMWGELDDSKVISILTDIFEAQTGRDPFIDLNITTALGREVVRHLSQKVEGSAATFANYIRSESNGS